MGSNFLGQAALGIFLQALACVGQYEILAPTYWALEIHQASLKPDPSYILALSSLQKSFADICARVESVIGLINWELFFRPRPLSPVGNQFQLYLLV